MSYPEQVFWRVTRRSRVKRPRAGLAGLVSWVVAALADRDLFFHD